MQRTLPYLVTLLSEPSSGGIRAQALRSIVKVMSSVTSLSPSDSKLFHDYLLPSLSTLPNDPEESVRVEYALGVVKLALVAHGLLVRLQQDANLKASRQAQVAVAASRQAHVAVAVHVPLPTAPAGQPEGGAVERERSQGGNVGLPGGLMDPPAPPPLILLEPLRYDHDLSCARQSMESVIKDLLIGSRQPSADHHGESHHVTLARVTPLVRHCTCRV